jgi:hypothetical protein
MSKKKNRSPGSQALLPEPENENLRMEIQAAIAAGRELDPDMDQHLADSVIERYRRENMVHSKGQVLHPQTSSPAFFFTGEGVGKVLLPLAGLGVFVAILIFRPELWWVIFFLPMLCSWWGWDYHSQRKRSQREFH